jgi:hypothetical protein
MAVAERVAPNFSFRMAGTATPFEEKPVLVNATGSSALRIIRGM